MVLWPIRARVLFELFYKLLLFTNVHFWKAVMNKLLNPRGGTFVKKTTKSLTG